MKGIFDSIFILLSYAQQWWVYGQAYQGDNFRYQQGLRSGQHINMLE